MTKNRQKPGGKNKVHKGGSTNDPQWWGRSRGGGAGGIGLVQFGEIGWVKEVRLFFLPAAKPTGHSYSWEGGGSPQAPISYLVTYELFETLMYCDPPPQARNPMEMYATGHRKARVVVVARPFFTCYGCCYYRSLPVLFLINFGLHFIILGSFYKHYWVGTGSTPLGCPKRSVGRLTLFMQNIFLGHSQFPFLGIHFVVPVFGAQYGPLEG